MAERRMLSKTLIFSDNFSEMPHGARTLYTYLNLAADDDGFVDNVKSVLRAATCTNDDLKILLAKGYLLAFDSGIVVIAHWRRNNQLRKDRYHPTIYQAEKKLLTCSKSGVYSLATNGIPSVNQMATEYSLGKVSLVEVSLGKCVCLPSQTALETQDETHTQPTTQRANFVPPTLEEVTAYCQERNSPVNPVKFFESNQARKWQGVYDWQALIRYWETMPQYKDTTTAAPQDSENWLDVLKNIGTGDGDK